MRLLSHLIASFALSAAALATPLEKRATPYPLGIDVNSFGSPVNWPLAISQGVQFAYFKATEALATVDSSFADNFATAQKNGILRGAYHIGLPGSPTDGATQANFFITNGGGWTRDGSTLPGALSFSGGCSGLSEAQMVAWIKDFSDTYHAKTSRKVTCLWVCGVAIGSYQFLVILATTGWWNYCTASSTAFGATNPLWISSTATGAIGDLPAGWTSATLWRFTTISNFGDEDYFLGSAGLNSFASG